MSRYHDTGHQCQHFSPRGQRCRMLRATEDEIFCAQHLRQTAASQPGPETFAAELLDSTGDLSNASEINALLGNVAKQLARRRIDRKDAVAFGYLSQLLLCTLPGMEKVFAAQREARALEAVNRDMAKMGAHYLAKRTAEKAAEAARKSQNSLSTQTSSSSSPALKPAPPKPPAPPDIALPPQPLTYADVRT
ncbi:MAG: hypothetical protein ACRD51_04485 [Candidatus Acidiferrum sp.]